MHFILTQQIRTSPGVINLVAMTSFIKRYQCRNIKHVCMYVSLCDLASYIYEGQQYGAQSHTPVLTNIN